MKFFKTSFFLVTLVLSTKAMALIAPWYQFENQVRATLGRESCVRVNQLQEAGSSAFNLDLHVCRQSKANALAAFMDRDQKIGNITVHIRVYYGSNLIHGVDVPSNVTQARNLIYTALLGNPYYKGNMSGNFVNSFFARFSKSVVQYPADNLADAYGNINEVAADAFRTVLGLDDINNIHIGTTTVRSNALAESELEP